MGGEGCGHLGRGQFLERMHLRTRDTGLDTFPLVSTAISVFAAYAVGAQRLPHMLVANEGKGVLSKGEVTAARSVPLPSFPNWEGTLASQEGGSQLPEVSAEQVDRSEQRRSVRATVCGQRAFRDFHLFIMPPLPSALISHSHLIFKRALKKISYWYHN